MLIFILLFSIININCKYSFQNQADSMVSSSPTSAYPIAAVIVAIWQLFPDVGKLFLAYLYTQCPYLVPFFIPQIQGQSNEDYFW